MPIVVHISTEYYEAWFIAINLLKAFCQKYS